MEKTSPQKLKLGIFVVSGILLLLIGTYLIGNQENLFSKTFSISSNFKNASGLQKGANVRYSGLNIGTVKDIEMINDTLIRVDMTLQDKMKTLIKTNALASIGSDGIVGSTLVNIIPGKGNAPYVVDGGTIDADSQATTQEMLSTLSTTNLNAAKLSENLVKITGSLDKGDGTLGALLKDSVMSVNLQQTFANLNKASASADKTITALNNLVQQMNLKTSVAGVMLNDEDSGAKVKNVVANLETSSQKIETMSTNLDALVSKFDDKDNILNYVASDTTLVNQVKDMAKNADQAIGRFNDNMEALEHNFLFRGYFKKQEKLKTKASVETIESN
ncbi:MlaD family protein [Bizionia arctica]|uniref:Hypothetical MCE-family protein n=1 Tax=Bizionia arctica TaxID=1495645 RepID=A0A917GKX8_9FLAO|nr:MlaD family protein [Bizionia arctica]GGG49349.1 hypothetical MCE-family protein [Bizionia arctica]